MARNPDYILSVSFLDLSAEKSTMTVHTPALDNANYATWKSAFVTALRALSENTYKGEAASKLYVDNYGLVGEGQREDKLLVTYTDSVTMATYNVTIPGRDDATYQTIPGTDMYDLDAEPFAAFVTAFEDFVVSPQGNPVIVNFIRAVGRNI